MNREELYAKWQELYKKAKNNMHLAKEKSGVHIGLRKLRKPE